MEGFDEYRADYVAPNGRKAFTFTLARSEDEARQRVLDNHPFRPKEIRDLRVMKKEK
jgi:hypothetical protein